MFQAEIAPYLEKYFATLDKSRLSRMIRYAVADGKCIRGFIVKHIIETLTHSVPVLWEPIVCVELIHAASLIVDDLPCMDDDAMRRGKPSAFKAFGKHEAILSAFYIVSESLRFLSRSLKESPISDSHDKYETLYNLQDKLLQEWCGLLGKNLVMGQLLDLQGSAEELFNTKLSGSVDENIIKYKTCSLFSFSFVVGAVYGGYASHISDFRDMGMHFGMMFQLLDDFKDIDEDKTSTNYVHLNGIKNAQIKYAAARLKFITLLHKHSLNTQAFADLIGAMDKRFAIDETHQVSRCGN